MADFSYLQLGCADGLFPFEAKRCETEGKFISLRSEKGHFSQYFAFSEFRDLHDAKLNDKTFKKWISNDLKQKTLVTLQQI
jgi:hypothetical protein